MVLTGPDCVTNITMQRLDWDGLRPNRPPPASKGERKLCQRCWRVKRFLPCPRQITH